MISECFDIAALLLAISKTFVNESIKLINIMIILRLAYKHTGMFLISSERW